MKNKTRKLWLILVISPTCTAVFITAYPVAAQIPEACVAQGQFAVRHHPPVRTRQRLIYKTYNRSSIDRHVLQMISVLTYSR